MGKSKKRDFRGSKSKKFSEIEQKFIKYEGS